MSRLPNVFINDMLGAIEKIQRYTSKMPYEAFKDDVVSLMQRLISEHALNYLMLQ